MNYRITMSATKMAKIELLCQNETNIVKYLNINT